MSDTALHGETKDLGGKVKETVGDATGDKSLQQRGMADQLSGKVQKNIGPLADKARAFAKQRPAATAALAGVIGLALLNTLRGRR